LLNLKPGFTNICLSTYMNKWKVYNIVCKSLQWKFTSLSEITITTSLFYTQSDLKHDKIVRRWYVEYSFLVWCKDSSYVWKTESASTELCRPVLVVHLNILSFKPVQCSLLTILLKQLQRSSVIQIPCDFLHSVNIHFITYQSFAQHDKS